MGADTSALTKSETKHRFGEGNTLRAGVLGANDGLVSNLSLVMGVSGAAFSNHTILVTGLAGLIAGAFSMALGEWISVQSSRELYERQIALEKMEIHEKPEEERRELIEIYESKGLSRSQATQLANQMMHDKEAVLDIMTREELGINPESLGGSSWSAALVSFFLFAVGAIVPVLPFFFMRGHEGVVILSMILSAVALFGFGAGISFTTSRHYLYAGFRQMVFGIVAATITFGIGRLIGVSIGG